MSVIKKKSDQSERRIKRVRRKVFGTKVMPRVALTQTNKNLYVQAINDMNGQTVTSLSTISKELNLKTVSKKNSKVAQLLAEKFSEKLINEKVKKIVLDRRSKRYHGIVKVFAEKLREKGIQF